MVAGLFEISIFAIAGNTRLFLANLVFLYEFIFHRYRFSYAIVGCKSYLVILFVRPSDEYNKKHRK